MISELIFKMNRSVPTIQYYQVWRQCTDIFKCILIHSNSKCLSGQKRKRKNKASKELVSQYITLVIYLILFTVTSNSLALNKMVGGCFYLCNHWSKFVPPKPECQMKPTIYNHTADQNTWFFWLNSQHYCAFCTDA